MAQFDVILVLPYPFSDHPSFPEGILHQALTARGFTVGVIETPFWQDKKSFAELGRPALFFAVISGPLDSIVLNYTASRRRRREDLYQFAGRAFFPDRPPDIKFKIRPDRTLTVFTSRLREVFRDVPVVIGGVEAGLRCFAHYDFQEDRIRRSVLLDSRADILVHGSGEKQIVAIAERLRAGEPACAIDIPGTARIWDRLPEEKNCLRLPDSEEVFSRPGEIIARPAAGRARRGRRPGPGPESGQPLGRVEPGPEVQPRRPGFYLRPAVPAAAPKRGRIFSGAANEPFLSHLAPRLRRRLRVLFDQRQRGQAHRFALARGYFSRDRPLDRPSAMAGGDQRHRRGDGRDVRRRLRSGQTARAIPACSRILAGALPPAPPTAAC